MLAVGVVGAPALTASPTVAAGLRRPARMARTVSATDTAHLHYLRNSNSLLIEEGSVTGDLPGSMRASVEIGPTATGSFTFYTGSGTITGHGDAKLRGYGMYASFAGTLVITSGTGRYAHAHGNAGLYGTFNRRSYALLVQTTGSLSY